VWPLLAQATSEPGADSFIDRLARTPLSQVFYFVAACTAVRLALYFYLKNVPPHLRSGSYGGAKFLNEALDAVIYAGVFVFMLIRPFGVQAFKIPSGSMVQTLQINDYIVANKAIYRYTEPKVGDIVVFRPPKRAVIGDHPEQIDSDGQVNVDYIKRLQGTPGDVVEVRNNILYRNGKAIEEPYKAFTRQVSPTAFENIEPDRMPDFKLVNDNGRYIPLMILGDEVNASGWTAQEYRVSDPQEMARLKALPPAAIPPRFFLMMGDNRNNSFDGRAWGLVPRDDIIGRSEVVWFPFSRWGKTR
jgi:signal peptidase I